ncbi:hypothetical protein HHK36_005650 [Tetracentron sinense]|uniref:Uncharacterized protein n=1 Tax=Tetracentron sinense TaxID=13715 RepID=A0A834ZNP3_TETSI|nr:hypothetical protein HHK36_005650 [Tetracentron sinense]
MAAIFLHFNGNSSFLSLSRTHLRRSPLCHKPMKVSMSQNQSYWASVNAEVDDHLARAIPVRPPLSVFEPMHHLVFAAPRTMAPALCIAACELVGGQRQQAVAAASALHLMHAASYTHEHLPLSDRPRPGPTTHHAFDANIELLTGDGIFPFGYELLASLDDPSGNNSERVLRVIIEVTRAMGSQGMVDGQYLQLNCSESDSDGSFHVGSRNRVREKKVGGLYACGAACGAILGGGSEEEIEKLRRYGLYAGITREMLNGVGREENGFLEMVQGFRSLALKELKDFSDGKVNTISTLVDASFCYV